MMFDNRTNDFPFVTPSTLGSNVSKCLTLESRCTPTLSGDVLYQVRDVGGNMTATIEGALRGGQRIDEVVVAATQELLLGHLTPRGKVFYYALPYSALASQYLTFTSVQGGGGSAPLFSYQFS
jgi:hypothetical protein